MTDLSEHPRQARVGRDTRAWLERAVIGLNLCPFAKAVYVKGQIHFVVSTAGDARALLDDLARELQVGVHLRANQLAGLVARPLEQGAPVAASCHTPEDLRQAEALGCDFAVVGSGQPTVSHPGGEALGSHAFARLREGASLPIYAIGGLSPSDITYARAHGGQGVAAIRGLWGA